MPSLNDLRLALDVRGGVQGVGFRPFVYRLSTSLRLVGCVRNCSAGVRIEVEGPAASVEAFVQRLAVEAPPLSHIQRIARTPLTPAGEPSFVIAASETEGEPRVIVVPDLAICPDCLRELYDPADRRYRYPFINCTNCGPRYSIIEALPYDRSRTTMAMFTLCPRCQAEYEDPGDRRFQAEPTACPTCGPHLELWDSAGGLLALCDEALRRAARAILRGDILALKGLGGFQLLVDASNAEAVERLRRLKGRPHKPYALMYPTLDLVRRHCLVSAVEEAVLTSPAAPIVLLKRHSGSVEPHRVRDRQSYAPVAFGDPRASIQLGPDRVDMAHGGHECPCVVDEVAPGRATLGVMLPYTPLHVLLMEELCAPVVATSGNLSDEPICTEGLEALTRLAGVADVLLLHDRPIARPVDDSVVRVVAGDPVVLGAARGYAPVAVPVEADLPPLLAVGGHLKNAVAVARQNQIVLSQHVGDLETAFSRQVFTRTQAAMIQLYALTAEAAACDLHPDYASTRAADELGGRVIRVQHHHAHVLAAMADSQLQPPVLGVAWDGTGYGPDGTAWGGEFLRVTEGGFVRIAHLRTFSLPGGEAAVREPRRSALGVLYEIFGDAALARGDLAPVRACSAEELRVFRAMLRGGINTPRTSSAGRLFDAVASLTQRAWVSSSPRSRPSRPACGRATPCSSAATSAATGSPSWPAVRGLPSRRRSRATVPRCRISSSSCWRQGSRCIACAISPAAGSARRWSRSPGPRGAGSRSGNPRSPCGPMSKAACELLGLEPLYVANEGRFIAFVAPGDAERALALLRTDGRSAGATRIGEVGGEGTEVVMTGPLGTARVIDLPSGEQLPRIC